MLKKYPQTDKFVQRTSNLPEKRPSADSRRRQPDRAIRRLFPEQRRIQAIR